jgi:hypothetical protein
MMLFLHTMLPDPIRIVVNYVKILLHWPYTYISLILLR